MINKEKQGELLQGSSRRSFLADHGDIGPIGDSFDLARKRKSEPTSADSGGLSNLQLATMAIAAAVAAANLYYCQPLLGQIARSLHMTARGAADIPMLTQVGYALGLLLFAPLGDMVERRGLATALLLIVTVALVGTALAPDAWVLLATSLITGMFTVVPQVMAPMASALSKPETQGRAVGIVMSGMLIGILLARTVAGFVGTWFGWRAMYAGAAVMMVAMAALLRATLPVSRPDARIRYRELLSSLIPLARKLPVLRQAAIMSGFAFGAFSAYWTTLVFFLEKPPYHYGAQMAGLLGLAGVAGALAAPAVGWLSDRGYPRLASGCALLIGMIAFGLLWAVGRTIAGLAIGGIVLDLGTQANLVTNQTRVYSLIPEARNRINTVFMVTYFVGGALGTFLAGFAWRLWQWTGVCTLGASFFAAALIVWAVGSWESEGGVRRAGGPEIRPLINV
jgi:predicted MFS family arabinose efflux permease